MSNKYEPITKAEAENIETIVTPNGFSVWIWEDNKKHWLLDGSLINETGEIQLDANTESDKYKAVYVKKKNSIVIVKKKS